MPHLTRTIATKVTAAEYEIAQSCAAQAGKTVSGWLRSFIPGGDSSELGHERSACLLLAEVLALRSILITLLFHIGNQSALTQDEVSRLIQQTDGEKLVRAKTQLASQQEQQK
jgi:hypothetical protein